MAASDDELPNAESKEKAPVPAAWTRWLLAWCVHFYTALGLVAAAGILTALVREQPDFRFAFVMMVVATLIDATDGTFARLVRVKEVLPGFDGRRLDDIIDFHTYTSLPLFLLYQAGTFSGGWELILLLPLLASAYGFSQVSAKTDDGYFLGFPSYWNLVAFYLYVIPFPQWVSVSILTGFALLTFVPCRYLYPTQRGRLNAVTNLLAAVWAVVLVWILSRLPERGAADAQTVRMALLSLAFPVYYLSVSWTISVKVWLAGSNRSTADASRRVASHSAS